MVVYAKTAPQQCSGDWFELPDAVWSNIFQSCDYATSTNIAVALASSKRYRGILRAMEPLNISDIFLMARISHESYEREFKLVLTCVRIKSIVLSSGNPVSTEWILGEDQIVQLSQASLNKLSCYLTDFSVLLRYPRLADIQLIGSEAQEVREGVEYTWDLTTEQASVLGRLSELAKLSFVGFTSVDLSAVSLPQLKVLNINFQALSGLLESQQRLAFSLPRDSNLDQLVIRGPEEEEGDGSEDFEEDVAFSMDTNVDLSIVEHCKNIWISGSSIVLYATAEPGQSALDAAVNAVANAIAWNEIRIELIKWVDDIAESVDPELHIHTEEEGLSEVVLKTDFAMALGTRGAADGFRCEVTEKFSLLDDIFSLPAEDRAISGMLQNTLTITRESVREEQQVP